MPVSELTMVMPAESRFISTARVTAASLAAELDFSIDEIDELRMGANELIAILTEYADDVGVAAIELRFVVTESAIEVHGSVDTSSSDSVELDVLARQILDAVVDSYAFAGSGGHIVKRRVEV